MYLGGYYFYLTMTKSIKERWYNNTWIVTVGSCLILAPIGTGIYDSIKSKPLLSTFGHWIKVLYDGIITILNYPMWYLLVFILLVVVGLILIAKVQSKPDTVLEPEPDFISYKVDKFKNWYWSWSYWYNSTQTKYEIVDLEPYCEKCEMQMLSSHEVFGALYYCPQCEASHRKNPSSTTKWEEKYDIKALIVDRIAKNKYQT